MRKLAVIPLAIAMLFAMTTAAFAKPTYHVSAKANHHSISYGSTITISGKVTHGKVLGKKVTLYWTRASEDDSWHKIGTDKLSKSGKYAKSYKPKFGGDIQFLVKMSATKARHGATRATGVVKVYQWQSARQAAVFGYTDDPEVNWRIEPGANGATVTRKTVEIYGTSYKSIVINDGASTSLDTYGCKAFRAHVGVSDTSDLDAVGHYAISQEDGPNLSSAPNLARGHSAVYETFALDPNKSTDITAQFNADAAGGTVNEWALGTANVKCNFPK